MEKGCTHTHTHTHSDLSIALNVAVRLALIPDSHAKKRSSNVFSGLARTREERVSAALAVLPCFAAFRFFLFNRRG